MHLTKEEGQVSQTFCVVPPLKDPGTNVLGSIVHKGYKGGTTQKPLSKGMNKPNAGHTTEYHHPQKRKNIMIYTIMQKKNPKKSEVSWRQESQTVLLHF